MICQWCGRRTPQYHGNQKYCSPKYRDCKRQAQLESKRKYKQKWLEKQEMVEKLGSSDIGCHRNDDFGKEEQIIKNELRKIKGRFLN